MDRFDARHASAAFHSCAPAPRGFTVPDSILRPTMQGPGPSFATRKTRVRGARAQGIYYEKKVQAELLRLYPDHYLPSPWFKFYDGGKGLRWCQPDGMLIDAVHGQIVVVEIKHSHTCDAWWKLHKLYIPVAKAYFGAEWVFRAVEIVRYFDPDIPFPLAKLSEFIHLSPPLPHTGVHILKP